MVIFKVFLIHNLLGGWQQVVRIEVHNLSLVVWCYMERSLGVYVQKIAP